MADVVAAEHGCTAARREFERLARRQRGDTEADALQQQRLARLGQQVRRVVRCRTVDAEPDVHAGIEHRAHRRDARRQPHVRRRTMRDTGAGAREEVDAVRVELDAVRVPDVRPGEAQLLRVVGRRAAEPLAREGDVVVVLGQVGVQAHAIGAARAPPSRASGRATPRTANRARRPRAASRTGSGREMPRSRGACRGGSRPRPRPARRAAGRRRTRRRSSRRGTRGSAGRSRAPRRSCRRAGRRWDTGTGDRWPSCSRRASARPSRRSPTR